MGYVWFMAVTSLSVHEHTCSLARSLYAFFTYLILPKKMAKHSVQVGTSYITAIPKGLDV